MSGASDFLEAGLFGHFLQNNAYAVTTAVYISLHTGDPLDTDAGNNEVTVGQDAAYARQVVTFGAFANGEIASDVVVTFPAVDAGSAGYVITHFGLYNALTGGNLLWSGVLGTPSNPQPKALAPATTYSFANGAIVLQMD